MGSIIKNDEEYTCNDCGYLIYKEHFIAEFDE